jgi:hypothetical protein
VYRQAASFELPLDVEREQCFRKAAVRLTPVPSVRGKRRYKQASPQRVYIRVPRQIGALASARTSTQDLCEFTYGYPGRSAL